MQVPPVTYGCCLVIAALFAGVGSAGPTEAGDSELQSLRRQMAELQQQIKDANDRHDAQIRDLERQIDALKQDANEPAPTANESASDRRSRVPQSFNPDISAIGDVLFHAGKNEEGENVNQFSFRELELALGAAVDPFGRADFFVAIEEEQDGEFDVDLEEGYFTFDTLPQDLKARVGKFYSAFGKANQFHLHAMPWVDKPLVIRNYFGEEGMSEPGGELSWLVPNPWDKYIELVFQVQDNRNDLSFAGGDSGDLMYVGHLKNFFDLNSDSSLEFGGSLATGENAAGGEHQTTLEGVDLTYKWRPAEQGLYRSLTWMNELLLSQKDRGAEGTVDSYGWYSSLEYQLSRRWSTFGRYDYSQFPDDDDSHENGISAGLTFAQSEYAFWRVQFTHADGEGPSAPSSRNELFLQLDFGIGPHRAHQY